MEKKSMKVWLDGKIVESSKAVVSILTHSLQYGSGIFEGIRSYPAKEGTAIFRLEEHVKRFFNSAKLYSMDLGYTEEEIREAIKKVVKANGCNGCYIRPFAFYDDANIGISVQGKRVSVYIAAIPFGSYFGKPNGIRCKVSSWRRISGESLPLKAKASGNYINSIIANNEAKASGFDEAILLSSKGTVAEGPGENIFLVKDNMLFTPDDSSDILLGITRDTIMQLAEDTGIEVKEKECRKDELYTADELFFCGTAAEVTPIINVDGIKISDGPGPITKIISDKYIALVHGELQEFKHWLTYV